jgi:hypothetical protein
MSNMAIRDSWRPIYRRLMRRWALRWREARAMERMLAYTHCTTAADPELSIACLDNAIEFRERSLAEYDGPPPLIVSSR